MTTESHLLLPKRAWTDSHGPTKSLAHPSAHPSCGPVEIKVHLTQRPRLPLTLASFQPCPPKPPSTSSSPTLILRPHLPYMPMSLNAAAPRNSQPNLMDTRPRSTTSTRKSTKRRFCGPPLGENLVLFAKWRRVEEQREKQRSQEEAGRTKAAGAGAGGPPLPVPPLAALPPPFDLSDLLSPTFSTTTSSSSSVNSPLCSTPTSTFDFDFDFSLLPPAPTPTEADQDTGVFLFPPWHDPLSITPVPLPSAAGPSNIQRRSSMTEEGRWETLVRLPSSSCANRVGLGLFVAPPPPPLSIRTDLPFHPTLQTTSYLPHFHAHSHCLLSPAPALVPLVPKHVLGTYGDRSAFVLHEVGAEDAGFARELRRQREEEQLGGGFVLRSPW